MKNLRGYSAMLTDFTRLSGFLSRLKLLSGLLAVSMLVVTGCEVDQAETKAPPPRSRWW